MRTIYPDEFPELLRHIATPPRRLYVEGNLPPPGNKILTIVGTRRPTPYGIETCERLVAELAGDPITIVSGLAIGIDGIAHRAALKAGLHTIAFPGSGLGRNVMYP